MSTLRIARTLVSLASLSLTACDEAPAPPRGIELRAIANSEVIPSGPFSRDNTVRMEKGERFDVATASVVNVGKGYGVSCRIADRDEARLRSFLAANDPNGIVVFIAGRPVTMANVDPRQPTSLLLDSGDENGWTRKRAEQIAAAMN